MDATKSNIAAHSNTNSDTEANKLLAFFLRCSSSNTLRRPQIPMRRPQQLQGSPSIKKTLKELAPSSSGYQYLSVDSMLTQSPYRSTQELETCEIEEIGGFGYGMEVWCRDFSSDGKLLASIGFGSKKVIIYNLETTNFKITFEEHSQPISDVRFKPNSTIFATSSYDGTVKIWDLTKSAKSLLTLTGHKGLVMSLDFDPGLVDILVCGDTTGVTTVWNVQEGAFMKKFEGGRSEVRFQPPYGGILATVSISRINIIETATWDVVDRLNNGDIVNSICWDTSGMYLASVSSAYARVWCISGGRFKCIWSLDSRGAEFRTCTFHPKYPNVLVIGGNKNLELWIPESGLRRTFPAHNNKPIDGLAALTTIDKKLLATSSCDYRVKLWNSK